MDLSKKAAIGAGAAVVLVGGGLGVANAFADTPSAAPTASASAQPSAGTGSSQGGDRHGDKGGRHGREGDLATKLASKLGLKEADVQAALEKAREAGRPEKPSSGASPSAGATPTRPDPAQREAAMAKALASELKVDEAKVTKALDEIRAERDAASKADLKTRLDEAVKAGKLTAEEADAVVKATDAGVIPYGGGRR